MATDYDTPRTQREDEPANESLEAVRAQRTATTRTAVIDAEDLDTAEGVDLPGADLSHEELTVQVVPQQADEFTCVSCFLVRHRSQLARRKDAAGRCTDCEDWPARDRGGADVGIRAWWYVGEEETLGTRCGPATSPVASVHRSVDAGCSGAPKSGRRPPIRRRDHDRRTAAQTTAAEAGNRGHHAEFDSVGAGRIHPVGATSAVG